MRHLLAFALLSLLALPSAPAAEGTGAIAPGKNLPGTFHPYNVTARPAEVEPDDEETDPKLKKLFKKTAFSPRGKYHCLVSEYDLDPVVMIVARNLEDNKALASMLKSLEALVSKNSLLRLRAFVVFQNDDLANVVKDDDKRADLAKKIQTIADDQKLSGVVLTLAGKDDLAKYKLDDKAALTAILYKGLKITASHVLSKDKLEKEGSPEVQAILKDVTGKLLADK